MQNDRSARAYAPESLEPRRLLAGQLVADINTVTESSAPAHFTDVNGTLYFTAQAPGTTYALWKSDGTPGGTAPVFPGGQAPPAQQLAPVDATQLTAAGGRLFYTTGSFYEGSGGALWTTDGTPQGTVLLKDLGFNNTSIRDLVDLNGTLYFVARETNKNPGLYKSDGTPAGTVLVKEFPVAPGNQHYGPAGLTNVNGTLYFNAEVGDGGQELWKSDGTAAGTVQVKEIYPGTGSSYPGGFTIYNGKVLFTAGDATAGRELWQTDGTEAGTTRLSDFNPGPADGVGVGPVVSGGYVYQVARTPDQGQELWRTDGTAGGWVRLTDLDQGSPGSWFAGMFDVSGTLLFVAQGADLRTVLYRSRGTPETTEPVFTIWQPGASTPYGVGLVGHGDSLYLFLDDVSGAAPGRAVWRSDGTAVGTFQLTPTDPYHRAMQIGFAGGATYFSLIDDQHGAELWKSDGTPAGTRMLKDLRANTMNSSPTGLTRVGDTVFFAADDGVYGNELWKSDGTAAGTTLVKDIRPGPASSADVGYFGPRLALNGQLLFLADDGVHGAELWRSDGTEAGTFMVKDIYVGELRAEIYSLYAYNGVAYFAANTEAAGLELWRSDGTSDGTYLVKDINPGPAWGWGNPQDFVTAGGVMYFTAITPEQGSELWRSDGTADGTRLVADVRPGEVGAVQAYPDHIVVVNDRVYFIASPADFVSQVWVVNEAGDGAAPWQPGAGLSPLGLASMDGHLYVHAIDPSGDTSSLYRDGSVDAPAVPLGRINAFRGGGEMAVAGHNLFIVGDPGGLGGVEVPLWKTDGTAQGTSVAHTFLIDSRYRGAGNLQALGDTLYFTGSDARGPALWRSDGTEAGTVQFQANGSAPVAALGESVLFSGYDFEHGSELWKAAAGPALSADAGAPYAAAEGETVHLSAAGSSAPPGSAIVSYEWDFNYNGVAFDVDATGAAADIPPNLIDGPGLRSVAVRVRDGAGNTHVDTALLRMTNVRPVITIVIPPTGTFGQPYALALSAQDPGPDRIGWRIDWGDGTPLQNVGGNPAAPTHPYRLARSYTVRVTPSDEDGSYAPATSPVTIAPAIGQRSAYYNNSSYDNNTPSASPADENAVAADKQALLPGRRATLSNVTNYARGINGIIFDLLGRSFDTPMPTAADFVFRVGTGPDPSSWQTVAPLPVFVRRFVAAEQTDRVTIALPDGTARNAWLQVTVLPGARTGLTSPDVFYFGNLAGDTGNDRSTPVVNTTDIARTRAAVGKNDAASLNRYDFNRDGKINAADVLIVRNNQRHVLPLFGAPAAPAPAARTFTIPVSPRAPTRPPRRGVLDTAEPPLLA